MERVSVVIRVCRWLFLYLEDVALHTGDTVGKEEDTNDGGGAVEGQTGAAVTIGQHLLKTQSSP